MTSRQPVWKVEHPDAIPASRLRMHYRIFETACALFDQQGIRTIRLDTMAAAEGTRKMSFNRSFASKDEHLPEYLGARYQNFLRRRQEVVARCEGHSKLLVSALVDAHVNKTFSRHSRGSGLSNAAVEIAEEDQPTRKLTFQHKAEIRRRFQTLASAMKSCDPKQPGNGLEWLMEGGYPARLTFTGSGPVSGGVKAARALMVAHSA